jgi:hypothetical protein
MKINIKTKIIIMDGNEFTNVPEQGIWFLRLSDGTLYLGQGNILTDKHYKKIIRAAGVDVYEFLKEMIAINEISNYCSLLFIDKGSFTFIKNDICYTTEEVCNLLEKLVGRYCIK